MSKCPLVREHIGRFVRTVQTWNPSTRGGDGLINYIDLSSVDQEQKIIVAKAPIPSQNAPSRARQVVSAGDVLVSTVRPNLNGVAMVPSELDGATASTGFCVLRADGKELSGRYLYHWVRTTEFVSEMTRLATGASYPAVTDQIVLESKIPLPPLPEQRRIAAILDQADALRTKRRQALARLDTLTQSIFLEMFGDPLTNPMLWPYSRMEEAISEGPKNGLYKPSSFYGSGTPIVRIDAFYDGTVSDTATLKRVQLSEAEAAEYGLCENDIVINRVNSLEYLGKSALIPRLSEPTVFESNMMRVRINSEQYHPRFVIELLQTSFTKRQILGRAKNAVNQSSINQKDVLALRLLSPPVEQQRVFALRAFAVEGQKQAQRASLARLDSLFASLQDRAFRGEL